MNCIELHWTEVQKKHDEKQKKIKKKYNYRTALDAYNNQ